ncbi:NrfD/PsrC family molybdoenzyme membrane anchor subunit [Avibacterium avium]|uniref:NrfD/PsrC family molybdoenzyme membrane anchor subunit n=1 Tax=Avibacterium avium TaxID=751 RepID=UPI003BF85C4F
MIREVLVEPQAIAWLPWAVSYFFFIGLALCSALIACYLHFGVKSYQIQVELMALFVALSFAIVAPIALTADLHQPGRVWHFYAYFANWSWMAWGSIFLPVFMLSLTGYIFFLIRQLPQRPTQSWLAWIYSGDLNNQLCCQIFRILTIISSILILLYTTMEVYNVAARSLWHQPWLIPLILFSAFPSALILIHLAIYLATGESIAISMKAVILFCLILLGLTVLAINFYSDATHYDLLLLWMHRPITHFTLGIWGITVILTVLSDRHLLLQVSLLIFSLSLTLLVRWVLLLEVQTIAKYNALMNPYYFTWSTDYGLGMLSVLGLWITISIILWQIFNLIKKGEHHG